MKAEQIRVLLADDHTMFRQGLGEMLQTDEGIEVVGQAENGAEAVSLARALAPDVVILDVEMPVMGAQEAMEKLLHLQPRPRIVVVTMHDDPSLVRQLLALGASAYLVKSASMNELLSAVHTAAENPEEGPYDENVVMVVPRETLRQVERGADLLSARELEILLFVARGLSNRQISRALHLSEATIKRHLANIYPRIGVSSRGEATRKALSEGWLSTRDVTDTGGPENRPPPPRGLTSTQERDQGGRP
ncbi:response regulator [Rubrobacter marinus]|uniref:Response regulator n=1 Tax=Rubrobacter marinus TaxID=2653852 RepID=A0A6G8PTR9_9ACTN|nr:response regulator transcription factor [Rubrobacter marinus]QIN77908.1 response regulator [Rubrobacter marinus]